MTSFGSGRGVVSTLSKSPTGSIQSRRNTTVTGSKHGPKGIADDEFMAAAIGDTEWLRQSLRGNRGAINYDSNGLAPIHLSAIHGRQDCLKLLIEKLKIDINLPSTTGWRPLHLTISNQTGKRSFQCLKYLISKGADPSVSNDDDITPMHQAASEGHVQCLKALIDAGASIDGVDSRGHKPLDLAKLWGHKKCARILAAEMWHREKDFIAKEMKQLQKLKMQDVLKEIEADEEHKADQQFYGDIAFNEWLEKRGLPDDRTGQGAAKAKAKGRVEFKQQKDLLSKPNSVRPKPSKQSSRNEAGTRTTQTTTPLSPETTWASFSRGTFNSSFGTFENSPEPPPTESTKSPEKPTENKDVFHNPTKWNKSTKEVPKEYVKRLDDHYPRDQYTMKPKYPPRRGGRPPPQSELAGDTAGIDTGKTLRVPKLPKDMMEKPRESNLPERNNEVLYKPRNIMDVQMRKHYDVDDLPRPEAGLHLGNDPESRMFRVGLQPEQIASTPSSTVSASTLKTGSHKSGSGGPELLKLDMPAVLGVMKRMQKPTYFPHIHGEEYVINTGQVAAI